ncbi:MAG: DUF2892 domain-containing protein [Bacteroidales bacterium]|nr:DUF2892 domain-containing protein [Bacteroidales bacterium]MCF8332510.1 DUF2892 domain-containing protein [Bacteroidales bacterium]
MKCNVSKTDKILRIILGLTIGAAGHFCLAVWPNGRRGLLLTT